jgi:hypothetical protein
METPEIVKTNLSCGPRLTLGLLPDRGWAGRRCARHLGIRAESWDALLGGETQALITWFADPCKNPGVEVVDVLEKWMSLVGRSVRFGSEMPYHLHLTKWSGVSGSPFACMLFLSWEGILVTADDHGLRSARRVSPAPGSSHSDYGFFATGWLKLQEKARRTTWFPEEPARPMEEPEKLCSRDGSDAMPPNIVKWRALGKKVGP